MPASTETEGMPEFCANETAALILVNCAEEGATVTTELAEDCVLETVEEASEEVETTLLLDELPRLDERLAVDERLEVSELVDRTFGETELVETELVDELLAVLPVLDTLAICEASESLIALRMEGGTQVISKLEYPGNERPKTWSIEKADI